MDSDSIFRMYFLIRMASFALCETKADHLSNESLNISLLKVFPKEPSSRISSVLLEDPGDCHACTSMKSWFECCPSLCCYHRFRKGKE